MKSTSTKQKKKREREEKKKNMSAHSELDLHPLLRLREKKVIKDLVCMTTVLCMDHTKP